MLSGAWGDQREKKIGRVFSTLFVTVIFALQLMDLATFWELRAGAYFVRFFPTLLGIFYASKVFEIFTEEVKEQALEGELAKGYRKKGMQAAHDLKSPILGARFAIKQMQERMSSQEKTTLQNAIESISEISSTLATDFTEKESLAPKVLASICQDIVDEKSLEYRSKGDLKISFHCEEKANTTEATVDEILLKRVLSNLINNSVQAITLDRVGNIAVSLKTTNDIAEITVSDNGQGVESYKIPELFKEGFTTKQSGQGLGLYHAKTSLRDMGGDLVMTSTLGVGSSITLKIPTAPAQNQEAASIRREESAVVTADATKEQKAPNIVLIDDDEIVRHVWKSEAATQKANLKTFAHPKEFEKATKHVDPATTVVYVDACFDGQTLGPKFVELLKKRGFQYVFLSTAFPSNYFEASARSHGYKVVGKESPWASL
jgi:signal transduction histidine kinase